MSVAVTFGLAAYNVEKYLPRGIESAMEQAGDDIEILIVDDGSTDSTPSICDEYAKKDPRIRVIHQQNQGVSVARNVIIAEAKGQWISYIDGDDKLAPNAAETIRAFADEQYDIVFFDALFFRYDRSVPAYAVHAEPTVIDESNIAPLILRTMYATADSPKYINKTMGVIWGKIYRTDFLRQNALFFDPALRKSQDIIFSLDCLRFLKRAEIVRAPIYLHRRNPESIMSRYSPKMVDYNLALVEPFRREAAYHYARVGDEGMARYYMICILLLQASLRLGICHRDNPQSRAERTDAYRKLVGMDFCREAMEKCDVSRLLPTDATVYHYIYKDDFRGICRFFAKKQREEDFRMFIGRLGLNKLFAPLRRKLKNK